MYDINRFVKRKVEDFFFNKNGYCFIKSMVGCRKSLRDLQWKGDSGFIDKNKLIVLVTKLHLKL